MGKIKKCHPLSNILNCSNLYSWLTILGGYSCPPEGVPLPQLPSIPPTTADKSKCVNFYFGCNLSFSLILHISLLMTDQLAVLGAQLHPLAKLGVMAGIQQWT